MGRVISWLRVGWWFRSAADEQSSGGGFSCKDGEREFRKQEAERVRPFRCPHTETDKTGQEERTGQAQAERLVRTS
jgi:hypothetical protein